MQQQLNQGVLDAHSSSFFHGEIAADPFPLFAQMRTQGPVVQVSCPYKYGPQRAWIVTQMKEAVQVLKDHKSFTRQWELELPTLLGQPINIIDGIEHHRLRALVSKMFSPANIQKLRPRIQHIADELLDTVTAQRSMDLVHAFANPFSIQVISSALGIPLSDWELISEWTRIFSAGINKDADATAKLQAFSKYVMQLIASKQDNPQDDWISQLIHDGNNGDHLDMFELPTMVTLLIWAGSETTANFISIGTLMLLNHPKLWEILKADPSIVTSTVEELLRFNSSIPLTPPLFSTVEVELGGQHIQIGDAIMVALTSANRDELHFTQPDTLDITRHINRHIAFGQGIHVCLGAPLARLESDIAFSTLIKRMPNLHIATPHDAVVWSSDFLLRGLSRFYVTW